MVDTPVANTTPATNTSAPVANTNPTIAAGVAADAKKVGETFTHEVVREVEDVATPSWIANHWFLVLVVVAVVGILIYTF